MRVRESSSRLRGALENQRFVILRCTLQLHFPMGRGAGEAQFSAPTDGVVK